MEQSPNSQHTVSDVLNQLHTVAVESEKISIDRILDKLGRRSFGPIILTIGAFLMVPGPSDIPTVPSILGIIIIAIGIQILLRREHVWLPDWVLRKSVKATQLQAVLKRLERPTRWIDTIVRPRFSLLSSRPATAAVALACIGLSLLTPVMEFIPFSANVAGIAFLFFGLGLVAKDGVMNVLGFSFCGVVVGIGVWFFYFT